MKDMSTAGESIVIARGRKRRTGNKHFATSINQVPRQAEKGKPGEERWLILELKLLADVGIIGMPNAGKSTIALPAYPLQDLKLQNILSPHCNLN